MKRAACADGAFYPDFATVFVDKFFAQDKPEAGARFAGSA